MNLVRCESGHFYDADRFQSCPHCVGGPAPAGGPMGGGMMDATAPYTNFDNSDVFDNPTAAVTMPANNPAPPMFEQATVSDAGLDVFGELEEVSDEDKTTRAIMGDMNDEPVVGWLVCVTGEEKGKSYTLKSGRNFVGRGDDQDVVIKGDQSISRSKHVILLYDPKSRQFLVQPGESHELSYLNDEVILNPAKLSLMDKLQIGETKLIFVPLCGPEFAWEDLAGAE